VQNDRLIEEVEKEIEEVVAVFTPLPWGDANTE